MNTEPGKNMAGGEISQRANKAAYIFCLGSCGGVSRGRGINSCVRDLLAVWDVIKAELFKQEYLRLSQLLPAPIPADEIIQGHMAGWVPPTMEQSIADCYGRVRSICFLCDFELWSLEEAKQREEYEVPVPARYRIRIEKRTSA